MLVALLAAIPCLGCDGSFRTDDGRSAGSALGETAPTLAGKTIDGERLALSDLRGQVVLVNIWATWCKPCNQELPELARLHDELAPKGFTVLGVSVDKRQALGQVHGKIQQHGLRYPMLFDPEGVAVSGWNVVGYPTSVLVSRDGTLLWRRNGMIHPNDPELAKQIDAALAHRAP
ncbi:MAG: TlpA family protein disulfide reductase [Myxococcales bacterium]|nr:TlpA family protein disulfide reductase [Myxococcales bacterium]